MIEHMRRLAAHGAWADARLLEAARTAAGDLAEVTRELAHIRGAQETWLARIEKRPSTLPVWPSLTLDDLAAVGPVLDARLDGALAALTLDGLVVGINYVTGAGQPFQTPLGDILLHLLLHGQYHRGKASVALRALGVTPPNVDVIVWQRTAGDG